MCGRTFCAIDPICLQNTCCYVDPKTGKEVTPEWRDAPTGDSYKPSYNIGPTIFTPVLLSGAHFSTTNDAYSDRVIQPMRWGLIPSWHKDGRSAFKQMHNNCRGETISEKSTFSIPFNKGKRCVVIAEGFYEWKTVAGKKTPYLFKLKGANSKLSPATVKQESGDRKGLMRYETDLCLGAATISKENITETVCSTHCVKTEIVDASDTQTNSSTQPPSALLFMAGVFDVSKDESGLLYSYSVLTTEAAGAVAEIHHRMPVILETDEDISRWLNYDQFPSSKVKDLIIPTDVLISQRVTDKVNNVRYNEPECISPLPLDFDNKAAIKKNDLRNWFVKKETESTKRKPSDSSQVCPPLDKKVKKENSLLT